jgi:hypothetical protein
MTNNHNSPFTTQEPEKWLINTASPKIAITEDKLENCLLKHGKYVGARNAWIAPLSLLLSCLATLATAVFQDNFLGFSSETWRAVFIISTFASALWLIFSIINLSINWKKGDIDYLIEKIKGGQEK